MLQAVVRRKKGRSQEKKVRTSAVTAEVRTSQLHVKG